MRLFFAGALTVLLLPAPAWAQQSFYSHDNYTQYELLEPGSGQFAITYLVTERRVGALHILNQTRSGSAGSDIAVFDPQTGKPLKFDYMTGAELTAAGMPGRLEPAEHYIRAHLARPVPPNGEGRVKILKTYQDEKSYFVEEGNVVFRRSLGNARNSVVLPKGFRLLSSNVAAQIFMQPDGRLKISFEHPNGYPADVTIRARRAAGAERKAPAFAPAASAIVDRAVDSTKVMYDLAEPVRNSVSVTHEYLETRPGSEVRLEHLIGTGKGATVVDLDTGKPLAVSVRGQQVVAKLATPITAPDQSARLRINTTLPGYFETVPDGFGWTFSTTAARAVILLPAGWDVASVSVPATATVQPDGRVAIQVYSAEPAIRRVTIRAAKR